MDASRPADQRAQQLLGAMTIDDKIALTQGQVSPYGFASEIPANDRLCIPAFVQSDGPAGIAGGFAGTQAGVTGFPVGMSQAATWDTALQRRLGDAMAKEALAKGANVLLAPAVNIGRIPLNGRNFEYFGEDPFLAARTAVAEVRGIQSNPVVATIKHYAVNNQEADRNTVSAEVDERTQREIYLPAFEAAVREAGAGSVMCAYNRVNGEYACENPSLLTEILKDDWGFDGWVMSDWGATHTTEKAALAGLDQEQMVLLSQHYGAALKEAVEAGRVPMGRLDDMVLRVITPAFRLGLFDERPAPQPAAYGANASTAESQNVALDVAEGGSVLLKNADGLLPLDQLPPGARIAVIGRAASPAGAQIAAAGAGSAHVNFTAEDPLAAITQRAASQQAVVTYSEGDSVADAAAAAAAADVAVVFVRDLASEGNDRPSFELNDGICHLLVCTQTPSTADELVAGVAAANPNTVVVTLTGGPHAMPWLDGVRGLLAMWYPGQRFGSAAAALLFGDVNPSGKLPQTYPRRLEDGPVRTPEQYPGTEGKAVYSEGLGVGYRWYDAQGIEPLFPFGFGLSYTTFDIAGLRIEPGPRRTTRARLRFTVSNTGERAGAEVPQVYVRFPRRSGEPPKQLKGFDKVALGRGESETVTLTLGRRAFSRWDAETDGWVVDRGCYRILVGRSSRDILQRATVAVGRATCRRAAARIATPKPPRCVDRRKFRFTIQQPRGGRIVRAVAYVNGRRVKTVRGRRVTELKLPRLPRGTFEVRIVAVHDDGRRTVSIRRYRGCKKGPPVTVVLPPPR